METNTLLMEAIGFVIEGVVIKSCSPEDLCNMVVSKGGVIPILNGHPNWNMHIDSGIPVTVAHVILEMKDETTEGGAIEEFKKKFQNEGCLVVITDRDSIKHYINTK